MQLDARYTVHEKDARLRGPALPQEQLDARIRLLDLGEALAEKGPTEQVSAARPADTRTAAAARPATRDRTKSAPPQRPWTRQNPSRLDHPGDIRP